MTITEKEIMQSLLDETKKTMERQKAFKLGPPCDYDFDFMLALLGAVKDKFPAVKWSQLRKDATQIFEVMEWCEERPDLRRN